MFVASDVFRQAAEVQADALGYRNVARVFVPHPIQDATNPEMRERADAVIDQLIAALTDPS